MSGILAVRLLVAALALCCCMAEAAEGWVVQRIVAVNYPPLARAARIEGNVTVACEIDEPNSAPKSCTRVTGHRLLTDPLTQSLKSWRFKRDPDATAASPEITLHFEYILAGPASDTPGDEFSFEFPSTGRVIATPACPDHNPCNSSDHRPAPERSSRTASITGMPHFLLALLPGLEGEVQVGCDVEADGTAKECFAGTAFPILARSAVHCASRWRWPAGVGKREVRLLFRFRWTGLESANPRSEFRVDLADQITVLRDRPLVQVH